MRRLVVEEPVTRLAAWSGRLAGFALAVALIGLFLLRAERIDLSAGFAVLGAALVAAVAALALASLAFVRIWREGRRGLGQAVGGFLLALALLAWPGFVAAKAFYLPRINDLSTDLVDPPAFARSRVVLAAREGRVPGELPAETRRLQREAYPGVVSLTLELAPEEAFDVARKGAERLGWQVIETSKPGGRIGTGRIEAIDHSFLLRFADDVTIRLRPRAEGTRIDLRSASRIGSHDFGANAARIKRYLDEVSALAEAR